MRSLTPVYVALVLASAVVSTILWRELRSERQLSQAGQEALLAERQALQAERQLTDQLRAELARARADLAPRPAAESTARAASRQVTISGTPVDLAALVAESATRQKSLYENAAYRKARVAEVLVTLKDRNPVLARELGITDQQADAVFDLLAESQVRQDEQSATLAAAGATNDAAAIAEITRLQKEQQQADEAKLLAMLGPAKYEQMQIIEQTQSARTRISNLRNLLSQAGQPLTNDQLLSLTKLMSSEQQRAERESQELRASGQYAQVSQLDRAVEGDRRILDGVSGFLNPRQVETIRTRFEQRQSMERASGAVTTRERALAPETTNQR